MSEICYMLYVDTRMENRFGFTRRRVLSRCRSVRTDGLPAGSPVLVRGRPIGFPATLSLPTFGVGPAPFRPPFANAGKRPLLRRVCGPRGPRAVMCMLPVLLCWSLLDASEIEFTPSLRFSYFSGYTQYEINGVETVSGETYKWRSRLKFPINNLRLDADIAARLEDQVEFTLGGWTTLDEDAGTLRDDDYINGIKDVWSRSDADLDAFGIYGSMNLWLWDDDGLQVGPTFAFAYDCLQYSIYDVRQFALIPDLRANIDGKVLTYDQELVSFPIGVATKWRAEDWFELNFSLAVSFADYVWDEDDHILRSKRSETAGLAYSVPASLTLDFILDEKVRLGIWGQYYFMQTYWAEQDQRFYAGEFAGAGYEDVEAEIERQSYSVGARLAIDF